MDKITKQPKWLHSVTIDVVIFTVEKNNLKVLLIKRGDAPFVGKLALPGGFLKEKEEAEAAARRILKDKAGVSKMYLEQLYTFDKLTRDPRGPVISIAYFALLPRESIILNSKAFQSPAFFAIKNIPKLAFDHRRILSYAVKRLRAKLEYSSAVFSLLPPEFTFNQLQKTYEIIFGRKFDKRNFRKKFLSLGLIKPTKKMLINMRQRPARMYKFASRTLEELSRFF